MRADPAGSTRACPLPRGSPQDNAQHLVLTAGISLMDALLGFNKTITLLNGTRCSIGRETVTMSGAEEVVRGGGLPEPAPPAPSLGGGITMEMGRPEPTMGDLKVVFRVLFPKAIDARQRAAIAAVLGEEQAALIERIVQMAMSKEADVAGGSMDASETWHSDSCFADDPWMCPRQPALEYAWVLANGQCARLAPGAVDAEVWGPFCEPLDSQAEVGVTPDDGGPTDHGRPAAE